MNKYLLDTSVIIDYLRGKEKTVELIKTLFSGGHSLGCCPINIVEIYAGMKEKEKDDTENFLEALEYYNLTPHISRIAGEFIREFKKKGITLSLSDMVIGAIAVENTLTLITDNLKHYPMPKLKIITPS